MRKTKRILARFLSITQSVLDSRPQTATKEEYFNHVKKLWHDLKGYCKECTFDKEKDCFYECQDFNPKRRYKKKYNQKNDK